jgi:hypothetical protein
VQVVFHIDFKRNNCLRLQNRFGFKADDEIAFVLLLSDNEPGSEDEKNGSGLHGFILFLV